MTFTDDCRFDFTLSSFQTGGFLINVFNDLSFFYQFSFGGEAPNITHVLVNIPIQIYAYARMKNKFQTDCGGGQKK